MAVFTFKLDPVLRHRKALEDQRQRELAMVLREKMILETQLSSMQQTISEDKRQMAGALVGTVDVTRIRGHASHAGQVTARAQQITMKLMGLHRRIDQSRSALLEATKGRKAVELLREKQHKRWLDQQQRREAAELDELATQAYGRRAGRSER